VKTEAAMNDIDGFRNEALRLLAAVDPSMPSNEELWVRRRAARMIELADRIEDAGSMIMTEQPSLQAALAVVRRSEGESRWSAHQR
jgi:hypothetical protein